jgi:hypothetical protein
MPVFRGSRYENVKFTGILGEDGKVRKFLHAREPLNPQEVRGPFTLLAFQRGDELDAITHRAAGKSRLWWVLADINDIFFPLDIEPGTELTVPVRELQERPEFG